MKTPSDPPQSTQPRNRDVMELKPAENDHQSVYLPSAEQIAEECRRIREEWSPNDQFRRRAGITEGDYQEQSVKST